MAHHQVGLSMPKRIGMLQFAVRFYPQAASFWPEPNPCEKRNFYSDMINTYILFSFTPWQNSSGAAIDFRRKKPIPGASCFILACIARRSTTWIETICCCYMYLECVRHLSFLCRLEVWRKLPRLNARFLFLTPQFKILKKDRGNLVDLGILWKLRQTFRIRGQPGLNREQMLNMFWARDLLPDFNTYLVTYCTCSTCRWQ